MPFFDVRDGRILSIKLEFNLSFHCNFSCADCSHVSPHLKRNSASLEQFRRDISALSKVYHVSRFRFVGGEPLLHGDIVSFIDAVRDSGLADVIQVCTNGALLHRAEDAFFRKIDMLSISWYPDARIDEAKIELARVRCEKSGTRLHIEPVRYFRKMNADLTNNSRLTGQVYRSCQIAHSWYCQTFFDGMFYLCSRPLVTRALFHPDDGSVPDFSMLDGIPIHEDKLLERLLVYLRHDKPLISCQHCLGTVGRRERWRALSVKERSRPPAVERNPMLMLDRRKLWYLLVVTWMERRVVNMIPSLRLARLLTLLKDTPYRWSRWRAP